MLEMKLRTNKLRLAVLTSAVALSLSMSAGALQGTGVVVANGGLNLRSTQSTSGARIAVMPNNSTVTINYDSDNWYNVTYNGKTGFASADYIRVMSNTTSKQAKVTANGGLSFRAQPSTSGARLAVIPKGTVVDIVEGSSNGWTKVKYNGQTGYCSSDYLSVIDDSNNGGESGNEDGEDIVTPKPPVSTDTTMRVKANGGLSLRSANNTLSARILVIPNGATVTVHSTSNGWSKVTYNGKDGYVATQYLEEIPDDEVEDLPSNTTEGERIVAYAKQFLGVPYVYGGASPSGFDCSGLTYYVYKQCGYSINRTATMQMQNGVAVGRNNLEPGDLVFFYQSPSGGTIGHVGMYVGNNEFIHAPNSTTVVKIESLDTSYYAQRYAGARRIVK
jgi:cell wall-associated NlpC family hydrolase